MDPDRLAAVMRYVELNPGRAGMVARAEEYGWRSARAHTNAERAGQDFAGSLALADWDQYWSAEEWANLLRSGSDRAAEIREATYGGRPLGSAEFVEGLEKRLERRLTAGLPGRPRKDRESRAVANGGAIKI